MAWKARSGSASVTAPAAEGDDAVEQLGGVALHGAAIAGPVSSSTTAMTMTFGRKARVASWIWVTACRTETTRPMASIASSGGPGQVQGQPERLAQRQRGRVLDHPPPALDRHAHDVLVGGDDPVAQRDGGLQRELRPRDRQHHIRDAALAEQRLGARGIGAAAESPPRPPPRAAGWRRSRRRPRPAPPGPGVAR